MNINHRYKILFSLMRKNIFYIYLVYSISYMYHSTTRVKAKNEKVRKNTVHKKSQHFKARNLGNTSSSESLSYEY